MRTTPDGVRIYSSRRYEKVRAARSRGTHTEAEWMDLLQKFQNRCLRCFSIDAPLTKDHVIPISEGGSDSIKNIQPLCGPCNNDKHLFVALRQVDYRPGFEACLAAIQGEG